MYSFNLHLNNGARSESTKQNASGYLEQTHRVSVLVVDQDASWRQLLCDMLLMSGLQVESCSELTEVGDILRRHPVELIVADMDLPGSAPWLEWIAREHADISLIATTGSSDVQQAVHTMRNGAFDYLVKPFKVGALINSVEKGLAEREKQAESIHAEGALSLHALRTQLNEKSDVQSQLELLAMTAGQELSADSVHFLMDEESTSPSAVVGDARLSIDDLRRTALNGAETVIVHGATVFNYVFATATTENISTMMIVPLMSQSICQGWLVACRFGGRAFQAGDAKLLGLFADRGAAFIRNGQLFGTLESACQTTVTALVNTLEEKDHYTANHSERVAHFSREIALQMQLAPEDVERVYQGGRLHDIGKLAVRSEELNKAGPLTDDEYERMKNHTLSGEALLKPIPFFKDILPAVSSHHERLDGSGYPRGLKGDEIPLIARIVAVADAYDAMTSDRVYRKAMDRDDAFTELRRCAGPHYDPRCVEALITSILAA